jgi:transcriptional regulator with XRE-family HTH domain
MPASNRADILAKRRAEIEKTFIENLIRIRREVGLSQSELSRRLGTTPGYICDLEHGRRHPLLGTIGCIAGELGVSPATLLIRANPITPVPRQKKTDG